MFSKIIHQRISSIEKCTVEELFGFIIVLMMEGGCQVEDYSDLDAIEKAIKIPGGSISCAGKKIVDELRKRTWVRNDLSRERIADHANGVQHAMCFNMMVEECEVISGSTIVEDLRYGKMCCN